MLLLGGVLWGDGRAMEQTRGPGDPPWGSPLPYPKGLDDKSNIN